MVWWRWGECVSVWMTRLRRWIWRWSSQSRHLWAEIRRVLTKSGDPMSFINDDDDDDDGERLLESREGRGMCKNIMRQANQRERVMTINMDTCYFISNISRGVQFRSEKNAFKPAERFRQLFHQAIVSEMLCNGVSQHQTRRPAETKDCRIP